MSFQDRDQNIGDLKAINVLLSLTVQNKPEMLCKYVIQPRGQFRGCV